MSPDLNPPILVRRKGPIGHVLLNRPDAMNAITVELGRELHAALCDLGADPDISVILIRGAGENFSVGGDFHEVAGLRADGPAGLEPLFAEFGRACEVIAELDVPVVAAVEGYAMAGGFELTMAADIALVRDDARLADNHSNYGQIPGGGSSQRLPRLVGRQRALGLILTGERLTGREAAEWGLVYRSYPAEEFDEAVVKLVDRLAGKSRTAAAATKRLVRDGLEMPLRAGLAMERTAVVSFIASEAGASGVETFKARGA